ncbi:Serrate RNA effector molecule [Paragonimus heterotremus]|uniref:Serrate RNA effector molecule n=1 Tax=Paragonimus heterotremus TaxID=100268 RepID=A0A8J4WIZ7_9TREM|nr:Serrate RNA effector molecule [Paragonimus heterotremus]
MGDSTEKTNQTPTTFGQTLGKADFARRPMSLRKFLEPFDHSGLTDYEAGGKYAAYKTSFAKQQLEDFFEKNKSYAWFREKYHPDVRKDPNSKKKLCEHRLEIFMELYRSGFVKNLLLNSADEAKIIKLLDTVAIRLAGGTNEDVQFLDEFRYAKDSEKPHKPNYPIQTMNSSLSIERTTAGSKTETEPQEKASGQRDEGQRKSRSKAQSVASKKKVGRNTKSQRKQGASEDRSSSRSSSSSSASRSNSSSSGSRSNSSDSSSESGTDTGSSSHKNGSSSDTSESSSSSDSGHSGSEGASSSADEGQSDSEQRAKRRNSSTAKRRHQNVKVSARHSSTSSSGESNAKRSSVSTRKVNRGPIQKSGAVDPTQTTASGRPNMSSDLTEPSFLDRELSNRETTGTVISQSADIEMEHQPVRRLPIHHTRVLYFPHVPLTVYQKDLIALLSTSPHFLRLAVMDPLIMRSSDIRPGQLDEPFFSADTSSSPCISLRRVCWATFTAQSKEGDDLVDVDVEAISAKLLHQATEAQAPEDMLECLRLARALPDHLNCPGSDRVRCTSHFLTKLMDTCPQRLYSKAMLRRHLVLAARLTDELDKARGLWISPQSESVVTQVVNSEAAVVESKSPEHVDLNQTSELDHSRLDTVMDASISLDDPDNDDQQEEANQNSKLPAIHNGTKPQTAVPIDPGDDLLQAANILGSLVSENPLLQGLTDYLVDEGSAEEELLLTGGLQALSFASGFPNSGNVVSSVTQSSELATDDSELFQVLDRLILYLRIVHSVDFYAPALYVNEDAMPHPCHLIHVRPSRADVNKALNRVTQKDGLPTAPPDYDSLFTNQLKRLVRLIRPLDETECKRLGLRDIDEVVENFVKSNTRRKRRKTDVIWVCLLSDKKFRDPIYVKKHIMNKHLDKVETVKKDTALFFNNYILDPMRPQLPLEPHLHTKKRRSLDPAEPKVEPVHLPVTDRSVRRDGPVFEQTGSRWYGWQNKREDSFRQMYPGVSQRRDYQPGANFIPSAYNRMPYFQPRLPFNSQRGRNFGFTSNYGNIRRAYPRRPYVDLDAM